MSNTMGGTSTGGSHRSTGQQQKNSSLSSNLVEKVRTAAGQQHASSYGNNINSTHASPRVTNDKPRGSSNNSAHGHSPCTPSANASSAGPAGQVPAAAAVGTNGKGAPESSLYDAQTRAIVERELDDVTKTMSYFSMARAAALNYILSICNKGFLEKVVNVKDVSKVVEMALSDLHNTLDSAGGKMGDYSSSSRCTVVSDSVIDSIRQLGVVKEDIKNLKPEIYKLACENSDPTCVQAFKIARLRYDLMSAREHADEALGATGKDSDLKRNVRNLKITVDDLKHKLLTTETRLKNKEEELARVIEAAENDRKNNAAAHNALSFQVSQEEKARDAFLGSLRAIAGYVGQDTSLLAVEEVPEKGSPKFEKVLQGIEDLQRVLKSRLEGAKCDRDALAEIKTQMGE